MTHAVATELPEVVFTVGVAGLNVQYRERMDMSRFACRSTFERLVDLARKRGFAEHRQLIGAAKRGRATTFAMERVRSMCALLGEDEIARELRALEKWERLAGRL